VCLNHEPVLIARRGTDNAVLISEEDWDSMQETMYLMSDKKFCEEIKDRMKTPISECVDDLDW
jgi:PHD/YefM family antitoxin component YafN of YafNO toxin-antitoxin module